MEHQLTIIVPVYNEADNIERLEIELNSYIEIAIYPTKILFIDDGSTDKSLSLIKQVCVGNQRFKFISFVENRGLSAALKAGFDLVETSLTGYIDADLQTAPQDFNLLLEQIDQYELINGIRTNRKDSLVKRLTSTIANRIRRLFTHDGMDDSACPLKIIRTDFAKRIPMFRGLHRFLPAMILLQGGRIKQMPISHFPRRAGHSKFGLLNRLFGPLIDCFAYLWMKKNYIEYQILDKSE